MVNNGPVEFTVLNRDDEPVIIKAYTKEDSQYLYRGGSPIKCSCGENYIYKEGKVYCPECNKEAKDVKSNNDLHLIPLGLDYNTGQFLYRLSDTLDYNVWLSIADCFCKLKTGDVDFDYNPDKVGWVTADAEKVETILGIRTDLKIKNRNLEEELEAITPINKTVPNSYGYKDYDKYFDIVDKLHEVFSVVETPPGEFDLLGEVFKGDLDIHMVPNPLFKPSSVGAGEYWLFDPYHPQARIWFVRLNYRDGDDLRMNNVIEDGELKAIGKYIPGDADVITLLRKLPDIKSINQRYY